MSFSRTWFLIALFAACGSDDGGGATSPDITGVTVLAVSCDAAGGKTTCASSYNVNGLADPGIEVVRGQTYTFNVSVFGSHPLFIKTAAGKTGSGSTFDDGVTGQGTATVTFAVPLTAPDTLFYQCSIHSGMNGKLFVVGP